MAQISRRAVLVGVVGVGLTACSKPSARLSVPPTLPPSLSPIPGATPTPFASVDARPRWPLTGKLLKDEGQARHAAVAVKVPDNRREHPQRGIDKADIVFVELELPGHVGLQRDPARCGLPLPHGRQRRASALHSAGGHPAAQSDPRTDRQYRRFALGGQLRRALSRLPRRPAVVHEHPPHRLVRH
jgi:hypothetical protein